VEFLVESIKEDYIATRASGVTQVLFEIVEFFRREPQAFNLSCLVTEGGIHPKAPISTAISTNSQSFTSSIEDLYFADFSLCHLATFSSIGDVISGPRMQILRLRDRMYPSMRSFVILMSWGNINIPPPELCLNSGRSKLHFQSRALSRIEFVAFLFRLTGAAPALTKG